MAGSPRRPKILGEATSEINRQFLDSTLARGVLGWEPTISLEHGLSLAMDWYADYLGVPRRIALGVAGN